MLGVGGADEEVVRGVDLLHHLLEVHDVAVGQLARRDPLALGDVGDRLAVLVGAGQEEDVLAALAHVPREHVGGDRRVRVAEVRLGVDVVDRGGDVEAHGRALTIGRRVPARWTGPRSWAGDPRPGAAGLPLEARHRREPALGSGVCASALSADASRAPRAAAPAPASSNSFHQPNDSSEALARGGVGGTDAGISRSTCRRGVLTPGPAGAGARLRAWCTEGTRLDGRSASILPAPAQGPAAPPEARARVAAGSRGVAPGVGRLAPARATGSARTGTGAATGSAAGPDRSPPRRRQQRQRVHVGVLAGGDANAEMQMRLRLGSPPGHSDLADAIARLDTLAALDGDRAQVQVAGDVRAVGRPDRHRQTRETQLRRRT